MRKKASSTSPQSKFRFKKHDNIGVSDAEEDQNFLHSCFVDTGDWRPCAISITRAVLFLVGQAQARQLS